MNRYSIWFTGLVVFSLLLGIALSGKTGAESSKPLIVTGQDLAFRVDAITDDAVHGKFLVRLGGEWVEVKAPPVPDVLPAKP